MHLFKEKGIPKKQRFMLPIGTTDSKILHPSSSTLCTKEMIFGKTHVPVFKGIHERFSPDSSRISLSGTIIDFTQIIQSFNNLCQTATTSADPLPQVFWCVQKKGCPLPLLFISFCHLSSLYSTQESKQCYSSPKLAQPHQATADNTQLLLWDLYITIPCLSQSYKSASLVYPSPKQLSLAQGKSAGGRVQAPPARQEPWLTQGLHSQHTERVCTPKALVLPAA